MVSDASLAARALRRPGILIGFALGGFFDGILLHQILQWHHLLSNVDAVRDLRGQVLADGLFHAGMYVIAAWGLAALWQRRAAIDAAGAGPVLRGGALLGFGAWHVVDAVVSHWVTGIHRIRIDVANPLAWDLAWFVVFGLVPALLGWRAMRGMRGDGPGPGRQAAACLAVAALVGGPVAARPPSGSDQAMVLFAPGVRPAAALDALADADARVLWVDASGGLWAVALPDPDAAGSLHRRGALLVSRSAIALGCLSWSRAAPARALT